MGMSAQSDWLAAISKNIANSNTAGYKDARTDFMTVLNGYDSVGGGVTTITRNEVSLQGSPLSTGTATDLAISGNGFFLVSNDAGQTFLTRAGNFLPDAQGRLVNSAGFYLMGYDSKLGMSGPLSTIKVDMNRMYASPTTQGTFGANLPYNSSVVAAANLPSTNTAGAQFAGKSSLTVYDNLGNAVVLDLYYAKTASNTWEMTAYNHADAAAGGSFPYATGPLTTQTLNFSATDGTLTSPTSITLNVPGGGAMSLNLSKMTQLGGGYTPTDSVVDGYAASTISGISVDKAGALSYQLANGQSISAYDIPLGKVASPDNLTSETGNVYSANAESGQLFIGAAGSNGYGSILGSSLEGSTVDLASQLSSMIVAQRSFTANSQVFQVASDIMQVLTNLK
jgi:flagellar hook protein FlgE